MATATAPRRRNVRLQESCDIQKGGAGAELPRYTHLDVGQLPERASICVGEPGPGYSGYLNRHGPRGAIQPQARQQIP